MEKRFRLWQLFGFATTSLLGTLLHYLYEWLGEAAWIAPFSGVNESTFEHMKLLFWPMLLFAIVEFFFFRERKDFWCVKLRGTLLGLVLIPVLFYTYNGVIGTSPDWLNIAIFFISAAVAYYYETRIFQKPPYSFCASRFSLALLLLTALCFVLFTFWTPHLGIFLDPVTGIYGI